MFVRIHVPAGRVLENEITQSIPRICPQLDMKLSAFEKQRYELGPVQRAHSRDRDLNRMVNVRNHFLENQISIQHIVRFVTQDIKKHLKEATYEKSQSLFKDAEK